MRLSRGAPKHPSIVLLKQFIRPKILLKATLLFFSANVLNLSLPGLRREAVVSRPPSPFILLLQNVF